MKEVHFKDLSINAVTMASTKHFANVPQEKTNGS